MDWTNAPWWWAAVFALCEFAFTTTSMKKLADKVEGC